MAKLFAKHLPKSCLFYGEENVCCMDWMGGDDCRAMGDWGNAGSKASKGKCGNKKFLIGVYIIQRFYKLTSETPKASPRMDKKFVGRVSYMIAVISDFAALHSLNNAQSYRYLNRYKGLDFIEKHYEVEHTLPFEDVIMDLTAYCKRQGGALV